MLINNFSKVVTGTTPSTKNNKYYSSDDYMFISPEDLKNNRYIQHSKRYISYYAYDDYKSRFIPENSIVIDCIGSDMGNVAITSKTSLTNQQINAITNINTNIVKPLYLYYLLSTYKNFFHSIGSNGSTMPIISKSLFENINVDIKHNLIEQQHIVDIIGSIDDKIENNNKIIIKLNEKIDFEFKKINIIIKKNKYYKIDTIKNYAKSIITGTTPSTKDESLWGNDLDFITIPDMQNNIYVFNTERKLSIKSESKYSTRLIPKNSLIISCIATVGLVSINCNNAITNQQINSIIFNREYDVFYFYEYFKNMKQFLVQLGSGGSATLNINKNLFTNIKIMIPNDDELEQYKENVKPLYELIKNLIKENTKLNDLKQLYLKKFFG